MGGESRQRYLSRVALREAKKGLCLRDRVELKQAEFLALLIQTVEPWKGIAAIAFGCACDGGELAGWGLAEVLLENFQLVANRTELPAFPDSHLLVFAPQSRKPAESGGFEPRLSFQ